MYDTRSNTPNTPDSTAGLAHLMHGVADVVGQQLYHLVEQLYPLCRSITGNGVRQTLDILQSYIPLTVHEVPTGTKVFDWTVPREWNIRDAYIKNDRGERIVDFRQSNLHVLNYSVPIHKKVSLNELKEHLFTIPEHPDRIPYRTSYYKENWGFCIRHDQLRSLADEDYEVCIDSSLEEGALTYGEYFIKGERAEEVLLSCHTCHPSLCNDNLSAIAVLTLLAQTLGRLPLRYSYRFLFIPGTIGSLTWLARNEEKVPNIRFGLVAAGIGDAGPFTYKKSRRGDAAIDRIAANVLKSSGKPYAIVDFSPVGYDERQYCSPGFNMPVGCLMRTPHGCYPEYHTSADNPDFVRPEHLAESLSICAAIINGIERNRKYINRNPKGEPQLGRRGLYDMVGGRSDRRLRELAMLWVLNLSDGTASLLDISERSGLDFKVIAEAADLLLTHGLLRESPE